MYGNIYIYIYIYIGESNRIWSVPEYEHYRYLRNNKSYKKCLMNNIFILYK